MKRKLRILYTIPNFDTAGSGKVLYDLVKGLDTDSFEVSIACKHNKGPFFKEVKALGFPIYLIDFSVPLRPYTSLYSRTRPFRKFLKEHQFDLIHSWHWSSNWTEGLSVRLTGAKYVYTKKAMGWNIHWKLKSLLSHQVIVINDEMQAYYSPSKCVLIPLGIDTDYFKPMIAKEINDSSKFNILTVANLVEVKGVELLIYALKELQEIKTCLTIVGGGDRDYINYLKNLVFRLELGSQVIFYDRQSDVRSYFESSDLYIIPTLNKGRKEGMPIALVEAMSMGIPVLGSDISGINFVLKDFKDLLFEPSNLEQLCEKISYIQELTLEQRMALGNKLRDYSLNHFSLHTFISGYSEFYKNLFEI